MCADTIHTGLFYKVAPLLYTYFRENWDSHGTLFGMHEDIIKISSQSNIVRNGNPLD